MNHPILFVPGLGGAPEHFGMDKAEPTCTEPEWFGTTQRIDKRPITIKNKNKKDITIGYQHWLVVDVQAQCNGTIRIPYHAELRAGASSTLIPMVFPITYERDGAVIKAGSARIDVDETVRGFEGNYIRRLAPTAEIETWRNFLRTTDRIEAFRDRSAPQLLASHFGLSSTYDREEFGPRDRWWYDPNTRKFIRPGQEINGNGLHVFQPKTWQATSQVCQEPEPSLIGYGAGTVLEHSPAPTLVDAMQLVFGLKCYGQLSPNSTRTIVLKLASTDWDVGELVEVTPQEAESFESTGWQGSVQILSGYMLRLEVGQHLRLYDYRHAADGLAYPLDSMYLPSEEVLPIWTGLGMDGGQADQLLVKMKDVLDEHYGAGLWHNNPNAQIDLVAHSQGGLVIREMIANNAQATMDNPVSHIRQILAVNSPLHGTALATDNTVLRSEASALDADLGQKPFPELAALRDGLKLTTVSTPFGEIKIPGRDCPEVPAFMRPGVPVNLGCLDLNASLIVSHKTPIGQYATKASLSVYGPWLGPYSMHAGALGLKLWEEHGVDMPFRAELSDKSMETSYLGWPQSSDFISNLVRDASNQVAPRYPGSLDFIPFTTLSSGSVGSFVQEVVWGVSEAMRNACPPDAKFFQYEPELGGNEYARIWVTCRSFRGAVDQIESQLAAQLSPIDRGWSEQGDLFVDLASQQAIRKSLLSWTTEGNPGFKAKSFAYNPYVLHGPFNVKNNIDISGSGVRLNPIQLNAGFPGASMQGCDILDQLGVTGYDKGDCVETDHTGFRNAVRRTSFLQINPKNLISGGGSPWNKLQARIWNANSTVLSGFQIEVPVHADAQAVPTARLAGVADASVELVPVAKGSWIARIHTASTVHPETYWPNENGFQLEIVESKGLPVRIALDDSSDGWTGSVEAVVRSSQGVVLSGIDPIPALRAYSERVASSPFVDVIGSGYQSRGSDLVWTKPVLSLRNEAERRLENFDVFYQVQARADGAKPAIELWNVPYGIGSGSAEVVADGDGGWNAVIHLRGATLLPGQELKDIKFGLHWPDWATWDVTRDASEPGSAEEREVFLAVVDDDALVAMGTVPEDPVGAASWTVEGFDEGLADAKQIKPRLRLTNKGSSTAVGFTVRVPFTVPAGILPKLETWYVPGCTGSLSGTGTVRSVVYACPNIQVPPGGVWPDPSGFVFGLHDADWQPWHRGMDALTRELGASWKVLTSPEVVR